MCRLASPRFDNEPLHASAGRQSELQLSQRKRVRQRHQHCQQQQQWQRKRQRQRPLRVAGQIASRLRVQQEHSGLHGEKSTRL